jgi:thioredoxin 1
MILKAVDELEAILTAHPMVLVYLSHDGCQVCKVLKPKVREMVNGEFPKLKMVEINTIESPELSAQLRVFAIPTLLLFAMGKELHRFSRTMGMAELHKAIERPYEMMFE